MTPDIRSTTTNNFVQNRRTVCGENTKKDLAQGTVRGYYDGTT